jgi:hypothetical protein
MLRLTFISVVLVFSCSYSGYCQNGYEVSYLWPLKLKKQLSSGFGDIRPGRFHMGIDIRTEGKEGARVYAPEDGYVWRLKTSYDGYGKALYIKGVSGRLYVFGHLQKYNWDIGTYLRERQIESKRYYQDFQLEIDQLPIKKGEFIARTGQSGAGAPHLHFEVRDQDNYPTNPLSYPVDIGDNTAPAFLALWLSCLDDSSLYREGLREIKLTPVFNKKAEKYRLQDTVYISGRFAVKAAIEDNLAKGSFLLGPSHIRLLIDEKLYHEIEYGRLDFDENIFSILDRDHDPKKEEYKRVFNLYRKPGSRLSAYRSETGDGTFSDSTDGFHNVLIEASDPFGHTSRMEFVFYYSTAGEILDPFNKAEFADSSVTFMYSENQSRLYFDSVSLLLSGEESASDPMQVVLSPEIRIEDQSLTLFGDFGQTTEYRLQFFKKGQLYPAYYFSTEKLIPGGQKAVDSVNAEVIDNGILFTAEAFSPGINWLQAEIISDIGSERRFYRKTGDRRFSLFYHPDPDVDVIESIITRGPVGYRPDTLMFPIYNARAGDVSRVNLKPGCSLLLEEGQLFDDALLMIRDTAMPVPNTGYYIHGPYFFGPETVSFADWTDFQSEIPDDVSEVEKIGLYVFDEDDGWLWAGGEFNPVTRILHSRLGGAGVIAVIADTTAPVISGLNITENKQLKSSRPIIQFQLNDELSGIENDLNFHITIDDKWIVPEYDPERGSFLSKPHWNLTGGNHTLQIEVQDRCGNRTELTRGFIIGAKIGP